jgi:CO/xanthine dehydrogenase FAD-binding subunit
MKLWNRYFMPESVAEASDLLARYAGQARIIAGGTDLLVDAKASDQEPFEALVDITRIPEMCAIREDDAYVYIGAGVTHTDIVKSPLVLAHAACLAESCGVIGGPQVRNVATLGGNVAHALPAGDGTVSLVALDAEAEVVYQGERSWMPLAALFRGPGISLLDPTRDLLIGFRFARLAAGQGTAFDRIMRPQGVALPVLSCAVWLALDAAREKVAEARVCIAPNGPVPTRLADIETLLAGRPLDDAAIGEACALARDTVNVRTSKYRATSDYRVEMAEVLLRRTLREASDRAGAAVPA